MEETIMNIIMYAGNARTYYLEALKHAINEDFSKANEVMARGKEAVTSAHKIQTSLIQNEVRGNPVTVSLFMVHAQDHLMNALAIRDIVELSVLHMEKTNRKIEELKERRG